MLEQTLVFEGREDWILSGWDWRPWPFTIAGILGFADLGAAAEVTAFDAFTGVSVMIFVAKSTCKGLSRAALCSWKRQDRWGRMCNCKLYWAIPIKKSNFCKIYEIEKGILWTYRCSLLNPRCANYSGCLAHSLPGQFGHAATCIEFQGVLVNLRKCIDITSHHTATIRFEHFEFAN